MPSLPEDTTPTPDEDHSPVDVSDLHCLAVPARADRLPSLRRIVARWASSVGMVAERVHALTLATYEAMANVVTHAYRGVPGGVLELHATYHKQLRQVTITVVDFGRWRPAIVHSVDDLLRTKGRGLPLIRALAEGADIDSDDQGTTVRMNWGTIAPE
jgi:anti-sigma regulatory factor (Ser/Thr protein kinase)